MRWRRELREAREKGEPDPQSPDLAPISINLDLTTACNFRCTHCIDWDILNTRHKHRDGELRDSLRVMAARGLRSVILIGGGEPTLYPGFADFVAFLKELSLDVAVVTNGSRGDRLLEAVSYMGERDWIRLSLDSGSNELFAKMHRPVNAQLDLDEICSWVPKLKQANPSVKVGFSYIIVWQGASRDDETLCENIDEIPLAAERAKRFGFDYISLKPVLERQDTGAEVMDPAKAAEKFSLLLQRIDDSVAAAKRFGDERFTVYESTNLRVLKDGSWREFTNQPRTCHMQALRQVLTPTGLYNCPAHRGVEKARIGSQNAYRGPDELAVTKQGLAEILSRFDASNECREVTCIYNSVNWWLEQMIQGPGGELELERGGESSDFFL